MNKLLIIYILLLSTLLAQFKDIQYDRAGQYGVLSNNGQLMWNQDWQVGVLLFDGTFSNYPTRFGASYKNNFVLKNTTDFYVGNHKYPDPSNVSSNIDYYRGDFSYDQLEVDFNFEEQDRIITLSGFKRGYNGPYGQYENSNGSSPLQQSYRVDYLSKNDNEKLELSVGYFHTDSRLTLSDPATFTHKEKILSAGIGYSKEFEKWNYNAHGALYQQYYKINFDSVEANSSQNYLNRFHLNQFANRQISNNSTIIFGIEFDNQGLSFVDRDNVNRTWSTLYGGWNSKSTNLNLGLTITDIESVPYFKLMNQLQFGNFGKLISNISYLAKPKYYFYIGDNKEIFDKWLKVNIDGNLNIFNIPLNVNLYYSNTNSEKINKYSATERVVHFGDNLISTSINTKIPLIRNWKLDLQYRHTFEHNIYSNGIGDRLKIGLNISEYLFKKNLFAQLKLWAEAHLNHKDGLGYDGFHHGPYITDNYSLTLPDYWVLNLDFSVKVSKMTIGWRVYNILQTINYTNANLLPDINENYLYISNSNNFPPMNRLVTMHIIWEFDN